MAAVDVGALQIQMAFQGEGINMGAIICIIGYCIICFIDFAKRTNAEYYVRNRNKDKK